MPIHFFGLEHEHIVRTKSYLYRLNENHKNIVKINELSRWFNTLETIYVKCTLAAEAIALEALVARTRVFGVEVHAGRVFVARVSHAAVVHACES